MESRGGSLGGSLELANAFSAQVSAGVPVEIVEAENRAGAGLSGEHGAQNISPAEDTMDISVEADGGQTLGSAQLSNVSEATVDLSQPMGSLGSISTAASIGELKIPVVDGSGVLSSHVGAGTSSAGQQGPLMSQMNLSTGTSSASPGTQQAHNILSSVFPSGLANTAQSMLTSTQHSSQLAQSVMDQLSDSHALEMSSEAMAATLSSHGVNLNAASASNNVGFPAPSQMSSYSSTPASVPSFMDQDQSRGKALLSSSMDYGNLVLTVGANSTGIDHHGAGVLNDPDSPSSPESNFDTSEFLSNPLSHQDEVTQRLAQAGPIGVAAAAAIMSGSRKRKRQHMFETNPSFRKRQCSKLTKRLKETIDELSSRVGLQAVVVMYRPGKGNGKSEPSFKVFGAAPLVNIVKNQQEPIVSEMESALHQQIPPTTETHTPNDNLHELPPLDFDGIPTPVHKMTQAQLRTFIPSMLKYSTGRGKPGWGKDEVRPVWWPEEVPWANVRSDIRTQEQKRALQWTDALRRIVINCYLHHGRMDLLPEFSIEHLQQYLTPQVAEQLQAQLDSLQQQQQQQQAALLGQTSTNPLGAAGSLVGPLPSVSDHSVAANSAAADEVAAALNEITEASGGVEGRDDPEVMVAGDSCQQQQQQQQQQQVFTVDTGLGNTDVAGMPTLADANLAETAARLQKLADETGEVQYATQTVTVTDHDAKALGQPVGSTTTVLLTAYPGGHSGSSGQPTEATPLVADQQQSAAASGATNPSSVVSESASQQFLSSQPSGGSAGGNIQVVYSASHMDAMSSALPAPGDVQQSTAGLFTDSSAELAAELIREYSMGSDGLGIPPPSASNVAASKGDMQAEGLIKPENVES